MSKRDFLCLGDLSPEETRHVLSLAGTLKAAPKGSHADELRGRAVAIVMEKASTRTRVSFEVGVAQLGGHPVVLSPQGSQLARGEPVFDTARVLSRYCDAIVYRTSETTRLREMARAAVPVVNALSDDGHPVQVLSDLFTIEEVLRRRGDARRLSELTVAWVGDGASNMARSFVEASRLFGFALRIAAPEAYRPPADEVAGAGGRVSLHDRPEDALRGAVVVNTDVWTSMGQEAENAARMRAFAGWTVTEAMLKAAEPDAFVLHCLPAHRGEEIDDETIEGPRSVVWDQAENRLHVQKALLCFLLGV
ncbi:MAG: ornithine carbamoyltransferase [Polyangiaceae bacterium]|nr:ornithine carbamoyltransferase [Polyangiaceae bacterium]